MLASSSFISSSPPPQRSRRVPGHDGVRLDAVDDDRTDADDGKITDRDVVADGGVRTDMCAFTDRSSSSNRGIRADEREVPQHGVMADMRSGADGGKVADAGPGLDRGEGRDEHAAAQGRVRRDERVGVANGGPALPRYAQVFDARGTHLHFANHLDCRNEDRVRRQCGPIRQAAEDRQPVNSLATRFAIIQETFHHEAGASASRGQRRRGDDGAVSSRAKDHQSACHGLLNTRLS